MPCPHCIDARETFDERRARRDLERYRRRGPDPSTRLLIEAIAKRGVEGLTVLDVGGGIGAIQHELARRGAAQIIDAEASEAYLEAAREEAERREYADRAVHLHGDFVELADGIPTADVVTLDRVVCCYPDVTALVATSAGKALRLYGVVYPRFRPLVRLFVTLQNLFFRLRGRAFRLYVHSPGRVEGTARAAGLTPTFRVRTFVWEVAVFARQGHASRVAYSSAPTRWRETYGSAPTTQLS